MADVVPISGGPETAKIRNVVGIPVLIFITFGIYGVVWWYKINRELADLGRKHGREDLGTSPWTSVAAITIGWIIILPPYFSIAGTWKRSKRAQQLVGVPEHEQGNALIVTLGYVFFSLFAYGYQQNELNKVWELDSGGGLAVAAGSAAPSFQTQSAAPIAPVTPDPIAPDPIAPDPPSVGGLS